MSVKQSVLSVLSGLFSFIGVCMAIWVGAFSMYIHYFSEYSDDIRNRYGTSATAVTSSAILSVKDTYRWFTTTKERRGIENRCYKNFTEENYSPFEKRGLCQCFADRQEAHGGYDKKITAEDVDFCRKEVL